MSLHRGILSSQFGSNLEMMGLFCALLLKANHKDGYTRDGTLIKEGQFMTSQKVLALEFNIDRNALRRKLKKLESAHQIEQQSSNKNTIITITNWHKYQDSEHHSEHQVNIKRTSSEHQVNTNNNNNNNNNKNNNNKPVFDFDKIYDLYPKKVGRSEGLKRCKSKIKTQKAYDRILIAVGNYSKITEGTNQRYIKHFSSFMSNWEDYLEIEPEAIHSRPCKRAIRACLSAGITKFDDLLGRDDLKLSEADRSFISDNQGFSYLGGIPDYKFNQLFIDN